MSKAIEISGSAPLVIAPALEISGSAPLVIAPTLEIVAAAQARGRARELEPTVQELLTAL